LGIIFVGKIGEKTVHNYDPQHTATYLAKAMTITLVLRKLPIFVRNWPKIVITTLTPVISVRFVEKPVVVNVFDEEGDMLPNKVRVMWGRMENFKCVDYFQVLTHFLDAVFWASDPLCLSPSLALHFSNYSFLVPHPVNCDDRHLLAHAMGSDYTVAWQCLSKRTIGFSLTDQTPRQFS
jgi:hypothetical protein